MCTNFRELGPCKQQMSILGLVHNTLVLRHVRSGRCVKFDTIHATRQGGAAFLEDMGIFRLASSRIHDSLSARHKRGRSFWRELPEK